MTDPTIPEARKGVYEALSAVLPIIFDEDDAGLQIASDSLQEAVHEFDDRRWLSHGDHVLGSMQAYITLSSWVPETDLDHHEHIARLRPLVDDVEKALNTAHLNQSKQAHPAGKKI